MKSRALRGVESHYHILWWVWRCHAICVVRSRVYHARTDTKNPWVPCRGLHKWLTIYLSFKNKMTQSVFQNLTDKSQNLLLVWKFGHGHRNQLHISVDYLTLFVPEEDLNDCMWVNVKYPVKSGSKFRLT